MRNHVRTNSVTEDFFFVGYPFMVNFFCRIHTGCPPLLCTLTPYFFLETSYVVHKDKPICGSIIKASTSRQGNIMYAKFRGKPPPSLTTTPATKTVTFLHCSRTTFYVFFIMSPSLLRNIPRGPGALLIPFLLPQIAILNNSHIRHREKEEL